MKFSNQTYDILKYVAQIVLPALSFAYAAIGKIWGLPYIVEIPATITAIDTLLGSLLMISTSQYNKNQTSTDETSAGE